MNRGHGHNSLGQVNGCDKADDSCSMPSALPSFGWR